jgi:hypothetical protein
MSDNPTWGFRRAKSDDDYDPPLKRNAGPRHQEPVSLPSWTFDDPHKTVFTYGSPAFPNAPRKPPPAHPPMSVAEHLKLLAALPTTPPPEPPAKSVASLARPPPPDKAPGILSEGEPNRPASHQRVAFELPAEKLPPRPKRRRKKGATEAEVKDSAPGKEAV